MGRPGVDPIADFARALLKAARGPGRVLLTGPIDPDGDSIGACLALGRALRGLGAQQVEVAGTASHRYAWLPDADALVPEVAVRGPYALAVVLDGDRHRLEPAVDTAFTGAACKGIVDHHVSTTPAGYDLHYIDGAAASTCEMVHALLGQWGVAVDADLAALLYTGIIFDTGGFRHSNTTPATHRLAATLLETGIDPAAISARVLVERRRQSVALLARVLAQADYRQEGRVACAAISLALMKELGAEPCDLESIVDTLLHTVGVELACLFIERAPDRVKLSLRSRCDADVAAFARSLAHGGGGHARAAGALLHAPLAQVLREVPPLLDQEVARLPRADTAP